jgi:HD-GYP domain-containing protein (c-di-GMP phosphodiesterase class II)
MQLLKAKGVQFLKFDATVTEIELRDLAAALAKGTKEHLELSTAENIQIGKVALRYGIQDDGLELPISQTVKEASLNEITALELAKFMEIYEEAKNNRKLSILGLYDIVSGFINAFKQESDTLLAFAPLRAMDEYTFTHSTNVCVLNLAQAMALGIDGPLLHDIGIAAMLHDIGKLFIPEDILNKPGKLTPEEYLIIQQHPLKGAQHLLDTPGVPRLAIVTAYEHHMKYNFSGYPAAPSGWVQNICSQMTTISDAFDALRTRRSYKTAMDWDPVAVMIYELAGIDFHPTLAKNFIVIMEKFHELNNQASQPPAN